MPVRHTFVSAKPPSPDPTIVGSTEWNAVHLADIVNADVNAAAAIAESKLALNFATHAAVTLGAPANGLSLAGQQLSIGLASAVATGALSAADWAIFNAKQNALTFPLSPTLGGTGVANAAGSTLTLGAATSITGGGTIALNGFTASIPATDTVAMLGVANLFTTTQTITPGTDVVGLIIGAAATANALQVKNGASVVGRILRDGRLMVGNVDANQLTYCELGIKSLGDMQAWMWDTAGVGSYCEFLFGDSSSSGQYGGFTRFSNSHATLSGQLIVENQTKSITFSTLYSGGAYRSDIFLSSAGLTGFGTNAPGCKNHVVDTTTTTNAVLEVKRLEARVSTAATGGAAGFGVGQSFYAETATDAVYQQQALISSSWIDATNATRKAKMSLSAYDTAQRLGIEIEASGSAVKLGFYGVTTIVQPANTVAIDDALVNLGLRASGGDANFTGRVREPGTYAGIYVADAVTAQSIPTGVTYTKVTLFTTNGLSSNCTPDAANDKITITKAGKYYVCGTFSMESGTNNVEFKGALFYDGTEQNNIHWERKIGTAGDVGNASFMGFISASANKDIDVRVRHDNAGSVDFTLTYANLTCIYVGE